MEQHEYDTENSQIYFTEEISSNMKTDTEHQYYEDIEAEETNLYTVLQELTSKIDSMEKNFERRLYTIERGIDGIINAFEGHINESINFRHEIKKAFKLTTRQLFTTESSSGLLKLPCENVKDVLQLEHRVNADNAASTEFRERIYDISGKDLAAFIRRALETIWTNDCAVGFSWSGQRQNIAVRDFKIISIIREMARIRYNITADKFESINVLLKKWFFYAGQRSKSKVVEAESKKFIDKKQIVQEIKSLETHEDHEPLQSAEHEEYLDYDESTADEEKSNTNKPKNYEGIPLQGQSSLLKRKAEDQIPNETKVVFLKKVHVNARPSQPQPIPQKLTKINLADLKLTPNKSYNTLSTEFMKKLIAAGSLKEVKISPNKETVVKVVAGSPQPSVSNQNNQPDQKSPAELKTTIETDEMDTTEIEVPEIDLEIMFPIDAEDQLDELEHWLTVEKNREVIFAILQSFKEEGVDLKTIFNKVFTNRFLLGYSWDGKNDNKGLSHLRLAKLMKEAWKIENESLETIDKRLRVCVFQVHLREKQAKIKKLTDQQNLGKKVRVEKMDMSNEPAD